MNENEDQVRLAALCDHGLVGQDGKVSLVGIFRNLTVSALPAEHPQMFLVAILALDPGPHGVVIRLRRPDDSQAIPNPPELSVHGVAGQDVNVMVELNKLTFNNYGVHSFDIEIDGSIAHTLPITVSQMQAGASGQRSN